MAPPIFQHYHALKCMSTTTPGQLKLQCKYCGKLVSGSYSANSNFHTHMKRWHLEVLIKTAPPGSPLLLHSTSSSSVTYSSSSTTASTSPSSSSSLPPIVPISGPHLSTPAQRPTTSIAPLRQPLWGNNDLRQIQLTEHVLSFISSSLQPLSIVEDPAFHSLLHKAQPLYHLPSSMCLSKKILPEKTEQLHSSIISLLNQVSTITVAVDIWNNSKTKQGFIEVTAHFVDDFRINSAMLAYRHLDGTLSSETIINAYHQIIASYNLGCKVSTVIIDNASNMLESFRFPGVAALDADCDDADEDNGECRYDYHCERDDQPPLDIPEDLPGQVSCFIHSLQLVVKDCLKDIQDASTIIAKAFKLVNFLQHSNIAFYILGEDHKSMEDIKWISTNKMLKSLVTADPARLEMVDYPHKLSDSEMQVIGEIIDILSPFEAATDQCRGQNVVTASLVIPCIRGLREELKDLPSNNKSSKMVTFLEASFDKHLTKYEEDEAFQLAAVLDPRWKLDWCKQDTDEAKTVAKLLRDKVSALSPAAALTKVSQELAPPQKKKCKLFRFMESASGSSSVTYNSAAETQVAAYLSQPSLMEEEDPLLFWKVKQSDLPELTALATNYLAMPAFSAAVERLLPRTGKAVRPDRSLLSNRRLEELMFLRCNAHLM
ncbi:E3 SUMO-protein ligase ZBED1-like [Asterias amurensis]|uniref:E3 SUMO-protein ligase ZBED1-like n=1 Tax=Asterias amurensis TaxID=7602 RepID=UPI003AB463AA